MSNLETSDDKLDRALDRALARTLPPPQVPPAFRRRLDAALHRAWETDLSELRSRLESERRTQLTQLESRYIRLRRQNLAILIATAFSAGATITAALPWLQRHFGANALPLLAWSGATAAAAIAFQCWRAHTDNIAGHE